VRPSSGAAIGFIQVTEHFPTACLTRIAAAGTAALRQRRNSTSEADFNFYKKASSWAATGLQNAYFIVISAD
jgi:hypothetical protein